ncbi:TPA: hypothetical protein ACIVB1_001518 [Salmonella enterica subsp. diarizonae serovar 61:l,v:z35]|uniref:hypothetical protein n=1 Tax=Citrobacter werkmanii TaxID=67827 RepID=UPI0012CC33F1|nr:hypothetical protein [Salmonella enterica subsp. enterica serovar Newport]
MSHPSCPVIPPPVPAWVTPEEAAEIASLKLSTTISVSDIYRHAISNNITLSIYFQSPVKLRRVVLSNGCIKLQEYNNEDPVYRFCFLNETSFITRDYRMIMTEGDLITPAHYVMDTPLLGNEMLKLQTLLADSLSLPHPLTGQYNSHYGVLVKDEHTIYQVFEYSTWEHRIEQQLQMFQASHLSSFYPDHPQQFLKGKLDPACFPVHLFPGDACFVVKRANLEKFIEIYFPSHSPVSSCISTPLSRLLWLACKHNDHINTLIRHPYKLLPVFEQWAAEDGITDHLSGDTLKRALKRGSPE